MSKLIGIIEYAHQMIDIYTNNELVAIDMTVGNGHDSLYMSSKFKHVYAFDVQKLAIERSRVLLKDVNNVTLINDSHYHFDKYVNKDIALMIFNLGYLPSANKEVTTTKDVSIDTINKGLCYLNKDGIMIIVVYPGHQAGYEEHLAISILIESLDRKEYHISKYQIMNSSNAAYVISIHKKKGNGVND